MKFNIPFQQVFAGERSQRGQGLVEYAFILALVALAIIVAVGLLGPSIGNIFATVNGAINMDVKASAQRSGSHDRDVSVQVTVRQPTSLTLVLVRTGASRSETCSSTCTYTFSKVGDDSGTIQVIAGSTTLTLSYPEKD